MKLAILYIGKPRDAHANAMAEEFVRRTSRYARIDMREIRPDRADLWTRHPSAFKALLDPEGQSMDSRHFASWLAELEQKGRELIFVIGGADGLPEEWKARADLLLSLSPMTWPHELARVMLAEQIYRAFTTLRGHPYPR